MSADSWAHLDSTRTNGLGLFEMDVSGPEAHMIVLSMQDFLTETTEFSTDANPDTTLILQMSRLPGVPRSPDAAVAEGGVSTATIIGRLFDSASGRGVGDAEIRLWPRGARTVTNRHGHFSFEGIEPGRYVIGTTRLGYSARADTVQLAAGQVYDVQITLAVQAIPLEGFSVEVRPRSWLRIVDGFRSRMASGLGGVFVTREEIERRPNSTLGDVLRGIGGVRIDGGISYQFATIRRHCKYPDVFVDGVRVRGIPVETWRGRRYLFNLAEISSADVEAVEIYKGIATVPGEFSYGDSACGVIVVWTRRGG